MTNPTGPQDQEIFGIEGAPPQPSRRIFIRLTSIPPKATIEEIEAIIKEAHEATQAEQNNVPHP